MRHLLVLLLVSACGSSGGGDDDSTDRPPPVDAGLVADAPLPTVVCQQDTPGSEVCVFPTQSCCFSFAGVECIGLGDACEGPGGTPAARVDCDGREDCGPGLYCCDINGASFQCAGENNCGGQGFLCNGPADCPASVPQCCDGLCSASGSC